ncbi:hypothetical protein HDU96_010020 [Phlyctochytrium bullatum]|nr:hypothetical protein HDU96_010020 [Phlyctochytrium bullatum]
MVLQEHQASVFRRQTAKLVSPAFGPPGCLWELTLYPEGHGQTRGTHLALYLDVVKSEDEMAQGDAFSRPIVSFHLAIMKRGSRDEYLVQKEREPANRDGFGAGTSHPKSWGWATMLPVSRLQDAITADGTLAVYGEVVWYQPRGAMARIMDRLGNPPEPSSERLLFSNILADVVFAVYGPARAGEEEEVDNDDEAEEHDTKNPVIVDGLPPSRKRKLGDLDDIDTGQQSNENLGPQLDSLTQRSYTRTPTIRTRPSRCRKLIAAHRAILASRSDYYYTMFSCGLHESGSAFTSPVMDAPPLPTFPESAVEARRKMPSPAIPIRENHTATTTSSSVTTATTAPTPQTQTQQRQQRERGMRYRSSTSSSTENPENPTTPVIPFASAARPARAAWGSPPNLPAALSAVPAVTARGAATPLVAVVEPTHHALAPPHTALPPLASSPSSSSSSSSSDSPQHHPSGVSLPAWARGTAATATAAVRRTVSPIPSPLGAAPGTPPAPPPNDGPPAAPLNADADADSAAPPPPHAIRIEVRDFSVPAITAMLEYIYTGRLRVPPPTRPARYELIRVADRYQIPGLHRYVSGLIYEADLEVETAVEILEMADKYGSVCGDLKMSCLGFIGENLARMKREKGFLEWVRCTEQRELLVEVVGML